LKKREEVTVKAFTRLCGAAGFNSGKGPISSLQRERREEKVSDEKRS